MEQDPIGRGTSNKFQLFVWDVIGHGAHGGAGLLSLLRIVFVFFWGGVGGV